MTSQAEAGDDFPSSSRHRFARASPMQHGPPWPIGGRESYTPSAGGRRSPPCPRAGADAEYEVGRAGDLDGLLDLAAVGRACHEAMAPRAQAREGESPTGVARRPE